MTRPTNNHRNPFTCTCIHCARQQIVHENSLPQRRQCRRECVEFQSRLLCQQRRRESFDSTSTSWSPRRVTSADDVTSRSSLDCRSLPAAPSNAAPLRRCFVTCCASAASKSSRSSARLTSSACRTWGRWAAATSTDCKNKQLVYLSAQLYQHNKQQSPVFAQAGHSERQVVRLSNFLPQKRIIH